MVMVNRVPAGCNFKLDASVTLTILDAICVRVCNPGLVEKLAKVKFALVGSVIVNTLLLLTVSTRDAVSLSDTTLLTVMVVVAVIANEDRMFGMRPVMVVVQVSI